MQTLPQINIPSGNVIGMYDAGRRARLANIEAERSARAETQAQGLYDIALKGEERTAEKHKAGMAKAQSERVVKGMQRGLKLFKDVKTPEEYQRAKRVYEQTDPELAKGMPADYDPEALSQRLEWGRVFTDLNDKTSPTGKLLSERDALAADDPAREVYDRMIAKGISHGDINYVPDQKGGYVREAVEKKGPKAADSNTIARQIGQLFGGFYDPISGVFKGLNREAGQQAQAVQSRAERIFIDGKGTVTHAEAVTQSATEFGVKIPGQSRAEGVTAGAGITHEFVPGKGLVEVPR